MLFQMGHIALIQLFLFVNNSGVRSPLDDGVGATQEDEDCVDDQLLPGLWENGSVAVAGAQVASLPTAMRGMGAAALTVRHNMGQLRSGPSHTTSIAVAGAQCQTPAMLGVGAVTGPLLSNGWQLRPGMHHIDTSATTTVTQCARPVLPSTMVGLPMMSSGEQPRLGQQHNASALAILARRQTQLMPGIQSMGIGAMQLSESGSQGVQGQMDQPSIAAFSHRPPLQLVHIHNVNGPQGMLTNGGRQHHPPLNIRMDGQVVQIPGADAPFDAFAEIAERARTSAMSPTSGKACIEVVISGLNIYSKRPRMKGRCEKLQKIGVKLQKKYGDL